MARKCKEDAEKTRHAILESALDVFSEKGYAKATFDEIAERAGFTKGAVYWHFRNKADLLAALIIECMESKRIELQPDIPQGNTLDDLLTYFVLWADVCSKDVRFAKFHRFILCQMEWSETVIDRVKESLNTQKDWHLEKVNQVLVESEKSGKIKEGLNLYMIQHIILSTYLGIFLSSLNKHHNCNVVEMVRTGLGLLFDGIKK